MCCVSVCVRSVEIAFKLRTTRALTYKLLKIRILLYKSKQSRNTNTLLDIQKQMVKFSAKGTHRKIHDRFIHFTNLFFLLSFSRFFFFAPILIEMDK